MQIHSDFGDQSDFVVEFFQTYLRERTKSMANENWAEDVNIIIRFLHGDFRGPVGLFGKSAQMRLRSRVDLSGAQLPGINLSLSYLAEANLRHSSRHRHATNRRHFHHRYGHSGPVCSIS